MKKRGDASGTLKNDVWYSSDGATWTQQSSSAWGDRYEMGGAVLNSKIYVLSGSNREDGSSSYTGFDDVWSYSE